MVGKERTSRRWGAWLRGAVLALLVLAGAALRLYDVGWDQFQQVHPDERFIVWVADTITWPGSLATALDPEHSTINPFRWPVTAHDLAGQPRNYAYGHFPLYLLVVTAHLAQAGATWLGETPLALPAFLQPLHTVGRHLASYSYLPLVGRVISALADLGTLVLVYVLARMLTSAQENTAEHPERSTAARSRRMRSALPLLAAAAYAFAVLPIQLSHYATVDALLTFCVTASVTLAARCASRFTNQVSPRDLVYKTNLLPWLMAGLMAGLAVGSKFSAVLLACPLLAAALFGLGTGSRGRQVAIVLKRLAAAGGAALLAFVLTNPFAVIESSAYFHQIITQNAMVSGAMDAPYTRQYIGTWPYLYFIQQLSQWGLGWPLGVAAWGGLLWATIQFGRRRANPTLVVMLAWALPYFAITGAFHTKFLRYMAPLLPFLLVFGAAAALAGYRLLTRRWGARGKAAWVGGIAVVAVWTVVWALTFLGVYRQEHPWIQASRWIYQTIPEGSKLLTEHWDDALPLTLDELPGVRPPSRKYTRVELPMWDPDTEEKLDSLVAELSTADYMVLSSERLSAPMQRLGVRYPMTSQYYRLLFDGSLGYRQVAGFTAYPQLGRLIIRDDRADESFSVYDHPHVVVLANTERLSASLLAARLGRYLPLGMAPEAQAVMLSGSTAQYQPRRVTSEASRAVFHERLVNDAPRFFAGVSPSPGVGGEPAQDDRTTVRGARVPGVARILPQAPAPDAPLTLPQPVDTLPVVADFRWDVAASESALFAVVLWWLVLSLFGWLAWPLLFPLLGGLRDRGYGLARAAGWLLIGWVHWMGVSLGLWQNRVGPLAAVLALLALCGIAAGVMQRREIAAFLRQRRPLLLGQEVLFAAAYLAFIGVRLLNPDLWQPWNGGEKFMDFAFLNAVLRSPHFPPYDPYFAGGIINYYYYGLYLVALPIKLTGIVPEVAFNLAVPGLYALTAVGVFSVATSLAGESGRGGERECEREGVWESGGVGEPCEPRVANQKSQIENRKSPAWTALTAVVLALLMGNLSGVKWLVEAVTFFVRGGALPHYDYWGASRVIPYTINEFPLWTFAFADLHPHLIAMPFGVLVVGLALNWMSRRERLVERVRDTTPAAAGFPHRASLVRAKLRTAFTVVLLVLALGALGAINTWDLPTYALLVSGAFLATAWRGRGRLRLAGGALLSVVTSVAAVAAFWPFYASYQARVGGEEGPVIGRFLAWTHEASPTGDWLKVWGFFLFLALSYVAVVWLGGPRNAGATLPGRRSAVADEVDAAAESVTSRGRPWLIGLLVLLAVSALLAAAGRPTAAIAALPMCLALPLILRRGTTAGETFTALLLALGLAIIAGSELVYLRDFLEGGEWYRMNTLFKFSVPAWLLLSIAGGPMLRRAWAASGRASIWVGAPWRAAAGLLLAAGFVFLAVGIRVRVDDRFPGARPAIGTLDGTAYMSVGQYTWPTAETVIELSPELDAIHWLLENVRGTPVIAEAPAGSYTVAGQQVGYDYYRAGGLRVASLTGFPTFVGPHQGEQRPGDQVGTRAALGQDFFQTTDLAYVRSLLRELRVGYVYVGQLERILFSADALRKFDVLAEWGELDVVYRNADVTIYQVVD